MLNAFWLNATPLNTPTVGLNSLTADASGTASFASATLFATVPLGASATATATIPAATLKRSRQMAALAVSGTVEFDLVYLDIQGKTELAAISHVEATFAQPSLHIAAEMPVAATATADMDAKLTRRRGLRAVAASAIGDIDVGLTKLRVAKRMAAFPNAIAQFNIPRVYVARRFKSVGATPTATFAAPTLRIANEMKAEFVPFVEFAPVTLGRVTRVQADPMSAICEFKPVVLRVNRRLTAAASGTAEWTATFTLNPFAHAPQERTVEAPYSARVVYAEPTYRSMYANP